MGTPPPARPLWDRLESIRVQRGWTGQQLAEKAGVSRTTINRWRTQPRSPGAPIIKAVAERLGIPYAEALKLAGITAEAPSPDPAERVRTEPIDLEKLFQDPEARAAMQTIVKRIERMQSGQPATPEPETPKRDEEAG